MMTHSHRKPPFGLLYDEQVDFIWRVLRRLGVPEGDVFDLAQDVFVIAHQQYDTFEGRAKVSTWLFSIARNIALNHRRKSQRRERQLSTYPPPSGQTQPSPEAHAIQHELAQAAEEALDALDEPYRSIVLLVDFERLTLREAAEALELSFNTAWSVLRTGRKRFDRALPQEVFAEKDDYGRVLLEGSAA